MGFFHIMRKGKGFTLIEVLIVSSILAMLASAVYFNGGEARKKARDTQRINDIQQLSIAFRLMADYNFGYPAYDLGEVIGDNYTSGLEASTTLNFLDYAHTSVQDPVNNSTYRYMYDSDFTCGSTSHVVVYAENMEQPNNSNFATVCSPTTPPAGTMPYIVILK